MKKTKIELNEIKKEYNEFLGKISELTDDELNYVSGGRIIFTGRSVTDITRLSPYGGNGMTFAGADGRTTNFTVDGANFNNDFGLGSSLPAMPATSNNKK